MILPAKIKVINLGIRLFYNTAVHQKVEAVHVNWQPTPKLEPEIEEMLARIGG